MNMVGMYSNFFKACREARLKRLKEMRTVRRESIIFRFQSVILEMKMIKKNGVLICKSRYIYIVQPFEKSNSISLLYITLIALTNEFGCFSMILKFRLFHFNFLYPT